MRPPRDLFPDDVPELFLPAFEVVGAVISSFLGIRKGKAMQRDAVSIKPHQVIAVAVGLVALFVVGLIFFVRMIVRSAGL